MPRLKQPFKKTEQQLAEEARKNHYTEIAEKHLNMFAAWLETEQACSKNTVKTYLTHLRLYYKWLDNDNSSLKKLYAKDIQKFKEVHSKTKAQTLNLKLNSLKKYNEFLLSIGKMQGIIILKNHFVKTQTRYANPTTITQQEVKNSLDKILNDTQNRFKNRDYLIVHMLITTGLRVSELSNIKLTDIDIGREELRVRGKGNKERTVYLSQVSTQLKKYLKNERTSDNYGKMIDSEYLFVTTRTEKISPNYVWKMLKSYGIAFCPHQCRHFFCTNCIENEMNIHEVAYIAGHSNVQTTMLYTNPSKEQMKKKMASMKF